MLGWWRSFPIQYSAILSYWLCSFLYRRFSVSGGPIYLLLFSVSVLLGLYLGSGLLCTYIEGYFPLSLLRVLAGFLFRSLIYLDLSFGHGERYGSICILLHDDIKLCDCHLLKMLSFFHCIILASLTKIRYS